MGWHRGKRRTRSPQPWTDQEVAVLRREWGEVRPRTWRKLLPTRTWCAIAQKAKALKLPFGCPQGFLTVKSAAVRYGYSRPGLLALCHRQGVLVEKYPFISTQRGERAVHHWVVELDQLQEAFERESATEVVDSAARARGLDSNTLSAWVRNAGLAPVTSRDVGYSRYSSADLDRVVAERRPVDKELLGAVAERLDVPHDWLRRRLNAMGVYAARPGGPFWVDPRVAEHVVEMHRGGTATTPTGSTPTSQRCTRPSSANGSARPRADQTEKFAREITANPAISHAPGNVRRAA